MANAGATSFLDYELYSDAGYSAVWENSGGGLVSLSAAPSTAPRTLDVYGRQFGSQDVAIDSSVYHETAGRDGGRHVAPAGRLLRGDRVVTVLRWDAPRAGSYTAVTPVPAGLAIESASSPDVEVSTDGGHSWRRLDNPDTMPRGTTHLRWRIGAGEGRVRLGEIRAPQIRLDARALGLVGARLLADAAREDEAEGVGGVGGLGDRDGGGGAGGPGAGAAGGAGGPGAA